MSLIPMKLDSTNTDYYFYCRDICPSCNRVIFPEMRTFTFAQNGECLNAIMLCPSCFIEYFERFKKSPTNYLTYHSYEAFPYISPQIFFPKEIKDAFPDFYKIYEESATAESYNLKEICGMGYRKALEALVKQYAIELFPNDKDDIEKELLMPTIKRFASPKILALATAAAWLGNDHVHLIAKHPEYDLEQLKSFINVLCQYIQSEKEIENAQRLITKGKTT